MSHPARRGRVSPVRTAALALGLGLAASVLAGCYVNVGALQHRTRAYPVSGAARALIVHGHVGRIAVTGASTSTISVTEQLTFRHAAPATTHRIAAGTLTLDSSCPALESCSVAYDITVPRALDVQVTDNVGTIRLRGLTGGVTAHTNTGTINLDSVSGPVQATAHAGEILGQGISSARATLRLSTGRIDVTLSAAPDTLTATATAGAVTLRVPGGIAYSVHASTQVGSIQVSVTRSAGSPHVITAGTTTGSVIIEPAP